MNHPPAPQQHCHQCGKEGTVTHVYPPDGLDVRVQWHDGGSETVRVAYLQRIPAALGLGGMQGGKRS